MVEEIEEAIQINELKDLVVSILSKTSRTTKQVKELEKLIKCKDVLFYTWKFLLKELQAGKSPEKSNNNIFMLNVLELLETIAPAKSVFGEGTADEEENKMGLKTFKKKFVFDLALYKKCMGKVWSLLINQDFSPQIHKKILFVLLELYISKLDQPVYLTDFLMGSMNVKGIISVLALEGMSKLMQKDNIEYPNIYGKLYTMFEPDILHKKFRSRLFYLTDIFLSSICLPESIVASFIKRIARLSLMSSPPDICLILKFIRNLLIRHPGLKKMIHNPDGLEVSTDPFLVNENDPMKTCASKSSLWEINLLKNHCLATVSSAAKFIDSNLPSMEQDMSAALNKDYESMFNSECKKKSSDKPILTYERPQVTVAKLKDDKLYKLWNLNT